MLTSPPSLCLPRQSRESFFDFPASSACFSCRCKEYSALQSYGKKRKPAVSKAPFVMFFVCSSSFFHRMALLCAVCRSAMFRATAHFLSITTGMFHYFACLVFLPDLGRINDRKLVRIWHYPKGFCILLMKNARMLP